MTTREQTPSCYASNVSATFTGIGNLSASNLGPAQPVPTIYHPFFRPPKPAHIRRQKQTYQDDMALMGFLLDEPLRHTRYSAALRYLNIRDVIAEHRAGLLEMPFPMETGPRKLSESASASGEFAQEAETEMVKLANDNDIIGPGLRDAPLEEKSIRIPYIQTPKESRKMRRVRDPERRERERFGRLIGGDVPMV